MVTTTATVRAPDWRADLGRLSTLVDGLREDVRGGGTFLASDRLADRLRALAAPDTPKDADADALLRHVIDLACRTTSHAILEQQQRDAAADVDGIDGASSVAATEEDESGGAGGEERAQLDHVLSVLYYARQARSAAAVCDRLLTSGRAASAAAPASSAASKDDAGGAGRKKRGGGGGGGKDARTKTSDVDLAAGLARFSRLDDSPEDLNRMQQLLLYLLNCAQQRGLRRRGDWLYARVRAPPPHATHDTHAWRPECTIRTFVYESTRKELNFDMWLNVTGMRGNVSATVEHLTHCHDVQLPDLATDRHVFAFRDGIYLARDDAFAPYGSDAHRALPDVLAAAKYIDAEFGGTAAAGEGEGEESDWRAMPTPHLQTVMDAQRWDGETCRWMHVFLGRLLYDVNELDAWQVVPYLKGAASSGKSTLIMHVCRAFYEPGDVGVLSNNIERKFGLSALMDKRLVIGPEIKSDIALEQAEFQSMVSGECIQVAVKFQTARDVEWRVPAILAGNQVPGWVDNSGSVNRRIVLFEFNHTIRNGDAQLGAKLEAELPVILRKVNRAYLEAVRLFARDNVWKHLPEAFHAAKRDLSETTNSIVSFLASGALTYDADLAIPEPIFNALYQDHVRSYGLRAEKLTKDALAVPLGERACYKVKRCTKEYPRGSGRVVTGAFVVGCDVPPEEVQAAGAGAGWPSTPDIDPLGD